MSQSTTKVSLPWLEPHDLLPPANCALGEESDAPGLLAAGGDLEVTTLQHAYAHGIFPWFSEGQPILWWSPDPRMVLQVDQFRVHRSFRKTLAQFIHRSDWEIRIDSEFSRVIQACATTPRRGQPGTWIVPEMVSAYIRLHQAGFAHSVETWIGGELVGGLYCVGLGRAVFGESMFSHAPDASKLALAALVAFCREHGITHIDCQQKTTHLASMGAAEMPRTQFLAHAAQASTEQAVHWQFSPLYWRHVVRN